MATTQPRATLTLSLTIPPQTVIRPHDERHPIGIVLRNEGNFPFYVNGRMRLTASNTSAADRDLWLVVTGPKGTPLRWQGGSEDGGKGGLLLIEPGKSFVMSLELSSHFELKEPGDYQLQAFYRDSNPSMANMVGFAPLLTDELRSNIVTLQLP